MTPIRKQLERLTDGLLFEITSALALAYQVRPLPSIVQRWRDKAEAALIEAMLIGQANAQQPLAAAKPDETVDELADTKPLKTRPPPPKH